MRCFQSLGLDEDLIKDMDETEALRWVRYDGTEIFGLTFPPGRYGHPTSYAIYQPLMEATLREAAKKHESVDVRYAPRSST